MKILIKSDDNFIIKYIQSLYGNKYKIDINTDFNNHEIVIFDNIQENIIKNIISNIYIFNYLIINISDFIITNITNIIIPFKISILKDKIDRFINYYNNNIININDGILNIDKCEFIDKNKQIIQFTQKEIDLIYFLYKNKNAKKEILLKEVWNIIFTENKILETTIHNIKQKSNNDFIIFNNGSYQLGKI